MKVYDSFPNSSGGSEWRPSLPEVEKLSSDEKRNIAHTIGMGVYGCDPIIDETKSEGLRPSKHDVFFIKHPTDPRVPAVAIKRFSESHEADTEAANMHEASKHGFWTFRFAGKGLYELDAGLGKATATDYVPKLITMDKAEWNDKKQSDFLAALLSKRISPYIGRLHTDGIVLGDPHLGNFAFARDIGFVTIDMERASFFNPLSLDPERSASNNVQCFEEINNFVSALVCAGYRSGLTDQEFMQDVQKNIFQPYLNASPLNDGFDQAQYDWMETNIKDLRQQVAETGEYWA